jgi:hypothetical protein
MWTVVSCSDLVLVIWPLYLSNWISQFPEWPTPMRGAWIRGRKRASTPPSAPIKNRVYKQQRHSGTTIRPFDKDYYLNQKIPPRGEIPKNVYQKPRTSTKAKKIFKNQLQTLFFRFLGREHRPRPFGVEFVQNYPFSQFSPPFLDFRVRVRCTNSVRRISRVGVLSAVWPHHM